MADPLPSVSDTAALTTCAGEASTRTDQPETAIGDDTLINLDGPLTRTKTDGTPPGPTHQVALPRGHQLNEFAFDVVLGTGGFAVTYLARDTNLQCQVAIKEYLPNDLAVRAADGSVQPRGADRSAAYRLGLDGFLAEARVLAAFRHPNIVRVTRFFEANNTAYMVMDYEQGEPLRDWVPSHRPLDEDQILRMFLPLLSGLAVVHKAGILHRDIKPANIYVRKSDGSLVLLDFGAARQAKGGNSKSLTSIVTPGYAPFEQYHTRGAQGPWSDLYALSGVLYWIVTGAKPLEAPSRIKHDTMARAEDSDSHPYSAHFLRAIDWGLSVDEDSRPRNVAEFQAALTGDGPVGRASSAEPPRPKRTMAFALGASVLALLGALAAYVILAPDRRAPGAARPPVTAAIPEPGSGGTPASAPAPEPPAAAAPASAQADIAERAEPPPAKGAPSPASPPVAAKKDQGGIPQPLSSAVVRFDIVPHGEKAEIYVDGKRLGQAPPMTEIKLAAGKHRIEIRGQKPPYVYYYWVETKAGEHKRLWARFAETRQ